MRVWPDLAIAPQNYRIAPQKQVSGQKTGKSRHKTWNCATRSGIAPEDVLKENTKMNTDDGRWTYRVYAA
jgi:hypothetical protein